MAATRKLDWMTLSCVALRSAGAMPATKGVGRSRMALALAILVAGASCTGDAPPAQSSPTDGVLPAAILGMAGPLGGQSVSYFAGDDATVGYLAVPEGAGPFPSLILIHEWNGLVDRVREVADAMAAEGYVTLAADLYSGRVGSTPAENGALMSEHLANPDGMIANLDAAARFLRERDDVTGRVGTLGWCFGVAWRSATLSAVKSTKRPPSSTEVSSRTQRSSRRSITRCTAASPRWTTAFRPRR